MNENTTKITAGIAAGAVLIAGGVDASKLEEVPIERVVTVANERVEAKQIGNVVEATLPWKDQPGIKVKYDMGEPTLEEKFTDKRKKQVITETVTDFDGGFKVDIILSEKPDTNRFCYTIEGAENYDFFYQPPLTADEIAEGAYRPPEIEGSFAVYHKTLKNHIEGRTNYATGKVMHIPRPQVWEIGNEEATKQWAELSFNDGQLCVTAPQEFLDKADYSSGVRIDPTFGYTSMGGSTTLSIENTIRGQRFVMPEDGTGVSVSLGSTLDNLGRTYKMNVYDNATGDTDGGGSPITDGETGVGTPTTTGKIWRTLAFTTPPALTSGVSYRILTWGSSGTGFHIIAHDASGGSSSNYVDAATFGTWPNPLVAAQSTTVNYSIYVTYTAGGGGGGDTPNDTSIMFF